MKEALTIEQEPATRPGASIWVGASAGTGKTHVLTARVLRLMLTGTAPEKILCVTFTKAAAAEMANRIFRDLGEWTGLEDETLAAAIKARVGEKADAGMLARARQLFAQVLDAPGGLKIQTIHSFCQSLLGRFPLEAALPPHFQVMDERTAAEFVDEATSAILWDARHAPAPGVGDALAHLAARINEQKFTEILSALAKARQQLRRLFRNNGGAEGLIAATRRALGLADGDDEKSLLEQAMRSDQLDGDGLKALAEALAEGTDSEQEKAAAISAFMAMKQPDPVLFEAHRRAFLKKDDEARKRVANKKTVASHPEITAVIDAETERLLALTNSIKAVRCAENTAALLRLASAFLDQYRLAKARHALLDYDDLILKTERLLGNDGIAPWILYKLDGGIDHILIDEAQDTNPEQWRLIEALSNEFFAGEGAREVIRTLFAVGDAKQSIFGFQRADPAEFLRARERTSQKTGAAGLNFENVALTRSFRSTDAVLGVVDEVFADPAARCNLTLDDEEIAHQESRRGESGLVEIWPPEASEREDLPQDWALPDKQHSVTTSDARLARRIAARIKAMIGTPEILKGSGRAIRAGDILVLVRRRGRFTDQLLRALKALEVPVAGADRMVLTDQLAVMDLMALARLALLPEDDLTLATVLKGPLVGLSEEALFTLAHGRGGKSLWRSLKNKSGVAAEFGRAYAYLADILARADFTTPHDFFARILNGDPATGAVGGRRALTARLGTEVNDPIDEFLSLAIAFERSHAPSLQGFLAWLAAGEAQIKRDMEQQRDEVRVMTIHGAKGLEAPVVFLPDTCQMPKSGDTFLWLAENDLMVWPGGAANEAGLVAETRQRARDKADAEYRRLLYVALTRARDRLYISGWDTLQKRGEGCWYNILDRAFGRLAENGAVEETDDGGRIIRRLETPARTVRPDERKTLRKPADIPAMPAWATRAPRAEPSPPRPLSPSRPEEEEPVVQSPLAGNVSTALKRGRIIHKLLEFLPDVPEAARAAVTGKFLKTRAAGLDSQARHEIWESLRRILEDECFAPLFAPGSMAEVSVTGRIGERVLAGQIDRLVVSGDDVLIVDYKSNRPPPRTSGDVPPVYLKQMAAYVAAIEKIYPGKQVRAALLWTEGARLMPLDQVLLAPHRPDAG